MINCQKLLDQTLGDIVRSGRKPKLLLHSCCAPCSSYVIEYLSEYFKITLFFYNPNITPREEFEFREAELVRLCREMKGVDMPKIVCPPYDPETFIGAVKGLESEPEGGARCPVCYRLRLENTARFASANGFDYFTTTLSISPYKDAERLNAIGGELAQKYGVPYLFSDFKKKNGYKRSCELSHIYGLYRQNYCGCVFSKKL